MKQGYIFLLFFSLVFIQNSLLAQTDTLCDAPYLKCKPFLPTHFNNFSDILVPAASLIDSAADNCTPTVPLEYSIIIPSDDRGKFPLDCKGKPFEAYFGDCTDTMKLQLWAKNAAGYTAKCTTRLIIWDIWGHITCNDNIGVLYRGCISTLKGEPFDSAEIHKGFAPYQGGVFSSSNSRPDGSYYRYAGQDSAYFHPVFDYNHINGVSSYDLLLLSRHILNIDPIQNSYILIAADANRSGTLTTLDIVELRKVILGIDYKLFNNTSWRFVERDFVFPSPFFPFAAPFQEGYHAPGPTRNDFIAIKIGDLNLNALPPGQLQAAEDRNAPMLPLALRDRKVAAGEVFEVNLATPAAAEALQFSLEHYGLELLDFVPEAPYTNDHFAHFPEKATLTAAFDLGAAAAFTLRFRAQHEGFLSEMLRFSDAVTHSEAVVAQQVRKPVLQFSSEGDFSIAPNPNTGQGVISFHLEKAELVRLRVYDALGRSIWAHRENYPAGAHQVALDLGGQKGIFYVVKNDVVRQVVVVP